MKTRTFIIIAMTVYACLSCLTTWANGVPTNFPGITVTTLDTNKVDDGYIFLAIASETTNVGYYVMILDNTGAPVDGDKYKELSDLYSYDFKQHPNGLLSYAHHIHHHTYTGGGDAKQEIVDEDLAAVETVQMGNGYIAEAHDFQILPNNHILLFGYYLSEVDMSQIVDSAHPAALVSGGVVQELDAQRNVVFQWRTWDHFDFDTYPFNASRSRGSHVSAFHLNTINQDPDGHIILGTPSEVRKINRQTGEIMWTLGGNFNEYTPVGTNANLSHFGGHATYRLANGNFLMYDNGNRQGTVSSKIHEYTLDEVNKTATHVWSWEPTNSIPAWHRGNAQRLPNGNTFIGWGGARGEHIPACTEVDADGNVVFELFFDDMSPENQPESYRAFRFPYPVADQAVESLQSEVWLDFPIVFTNTGVSIEIDSYTGSGYNEITVVNEPFAPVNPSFTNSQAPRTLPVRLIVDELNIGGITAEISFDALHFGFTDPGSLKVYHRPSPGTGLFTRLDTTYNIVTKLIQAPMTDFGEFVFCYADVPDVAYAPFLNQPENYRGVQTHAVIAPRKAESNTVYTVNQELPILLSWSPQGLARWQFMQVATDPGFSNLVEDLSWETDGYYVWNDAASNTTYHWRARINNTDGDGPWSTGVFATVPPSLYLATPAGGEYWQRGLEYWIRWEDNIAEDVVIELLRDGVLVEEIATAPSTGAYEWEVGFHLGGGDDYTIRIRSATDGTLVSESAQAFSIDVPRISAFQLETNGDMVLEWSGSTEEMFIESVDAYPTSTWSTVGGPTLGPTWTNVAPFSMDAGLLRLRVK